MRRIFQTIQDDRVGYAISNSGYIPYTAKIIFTFFSFLRDLNSNNIENITAGVFSDLTYLQYL